MSDVFLPPAVAAILAEGQVALEAERQAERQAELARIHAELAQKSRRIGAILTAACRLLPEALHSYLTFPDLDPNTDQVYCLLQVPGCVPVRVAVTMFYSHVVNEWQPTNDPPHPAAKMLTLPHIIDGEWSFWQARCERLHGEIGKVLAEARELETQQQQCLAEDAIRRVAQREAKLDERPCVGVVDANVLNYWR